MGKLNDKRVDSLLLIAGVAGASGFATFVPTPALEAPKQVVLGAADIGMCLGIYKIYFKEKISEKSILEIMGGAGISGAIAGGGGWVIAKGATGLLNELGNLGGPVGWATSGVIASSATAMLGIAWMIYCDKRFRKLFPSKERTSKEDLKKLWAATKNLVSAVKGKPKDKPVEAT
jgi:hypothetical protein